MGNSFTALMEPELSFGEINKLRECEHIDVEFIDFMMDNKKLSDCKHPETIKLLAAANYMHIPESNVYDTYSMHMRWDELFNKEISIEDYMKGLMERVKKRDKTLPIFKYHSKVPHGDNSASPPDLEDFFISIKTIEYLKLYFQGRIADKTYNYYPSCRSYEDTYFSSIALRAKGESSIHSKFFMDFCRTSPIRLGKKISSTRRGDFIPLAPLNQEGARFLLKHPGLDVGGFKRLNVGSMESKDLGISPDRPEDFQAIVVSIIHKSLLVSEPDVSNCFDCISKTNLEGDTDMWGALPLRLDANETLCRYGNVITMAETPLNISHVIKTIAHNVTLDYDQMGESSRQLEKDFIRYMYTMIINSLKFVYTPPVTYSSVFCKSGENVCFPGKKIPDFDDWKTLLYDVVYHGPTNFTMEESVELAKHIPDLRSRISHKLYIFPCSGPPPEGTTQTTWDTFCSKFGKNQKNL